MKPWQWRLIALAAITLASLAYLNPDMVLAAGMALWLCVS